MPDSSSTGAATRLRSAPTLLAFLAAALFLILQGGLAQAPPPIAPPPNGPIPVPILLYPNGAPGALGHAEADKPKLYAFLPPQRSSLAAVLVLPGGGYTKVALGHEGFQYAEWLNAQGIAAFVLDYRVAPYKYPIPINDAVTAMRMIRAHATDYGIDPDRIGVWGSSAGGHLAAILSTECHVGDNPGSTPSNDLSGLNCEPNFTILSYPVISMEGPLAHDASRVALLGPRGTVDLALAHQLSPQFAVTASTPPTFLFATTGDPTVPVGNSVVIYGALQAAQVPAELHIFDFANHGCGLCGDIPELAGWPTLLRTWLIHHNELAPNAPPAPPPSANMPDWPSGIDGPGHRD